MADQETTFSYPPQREEYTDDRAYDKALVAYAAFCERYPKYTQEWHNEPAYPKSVARAASRALALDRYDENGNWAWCPWNLWAKGPEDARGRFVKG